MDIREETEQEAFDRCAKQQAEKSYYANQATGAQCGTAAFSPLQERLQSDVRNLIGQTDRSERALSILRRHPEFEELIELLGLIRVDMKARPVSSFKAAVLE